MTFYRWLKKNRERDDEIGELARKADGNDSRPSAQLGQDYRQWFDFVTKRLSSRKSIKQALNTLDRAWYEWMYDTKRQYLDQLED